MGLMMTTAHWRLSVPRPIPVFLLAILFACSLAAVVPAPAEARTYGRVASLTKPTPVDRIVISRIGIDLPVRTVAIGSTIREKVAYHLPGTSWPGGKSNTYLYGHARAGTFLNLQYLRKGDVIQLRLGKAGWVRYKVTSVRRVRWNDRRWMAGTPTERLTLQTCTSYAKTADRLIVIAVPVA
jgi:LPXTG-site transpeptidase (sortase) family protein